MGQGGQWWRRLAEQRNGKQNRLYGMNKMLINIIFCELSSLRSSPIELYYFDVSPLFVTLCSIESMVEIRSWDNVLGCGGRPTVKQGSGGWKMVANKREWKYNKKLNLFIYNRALVVLVWQFCRSSNSSIIIIIMILTKEANELYDLRLIITCYIRCSSHFTLYVSECIHISNFEGEEVEEVSWMQKIRRRC